MNPTALRMLVLAAIAAALLTSVARAQGGAPADTRSPSPLMFDPPSVDFGIVSPGAKLEVDARLVNLGDAPVVVQRSGTSCGCTTADDLTGKVVPPKGVLPFHVTMNVKSGLGEKLERFFVIAPAGAQPLALDLRAEAAMSIRVVPPFLDATAATSGQVSVSSLDGMPFRILSVGPPGSGPVFDGFDPSKDEPRATYVLRWDLAAAQAAKAVPWFWAIETDRPDAPVVDVRVRHASTAPEIPQGRPWVPLDQRVLIGTTDGSPVEAEVGLEYARGMAPEPASVSVAGEGIKAELAGVDVEGQRLRITVKLTPRPESPPGILVQRMDVKASGFEAPIFVIGRVVPAAKQIAPDAPTPTKP